MKEFFTEINRFILVGIGSNVLNFLVYALLYTLGLAIWSASAIGYIVGLCNSFYFGKSWVFSPKKLVYKKAIFKFIIIYGFGGIGMVYIINILASRTNIDYRVIWFFGALFAFLNNYIGSKIFVFSNKR